eukprot:COSAG05_NODE_75_length_21588_cov_303.091438_2_plen_110_part_00
MCVCVCVCVCMCVCACMCGWCVSGSPCVVSALPSPLICIVATLPSCMHLALLARCRLPRYVLRQHLHLVRHLGRLWLHALLSIVVRQMVAFSASKFIYETFMVIHMAGD